MRRGVNLGIMQHWRAQAKQLIALYGTYAVKAGTKTVANAAFESCGITSITIPNSVAPIGDDAFYGCNYLARIHFTGTKAEWNSISKGSSRDYRVGSYTVYCTDGELLCKG